MRKFLVVANQTLGGDELKAELERRIAEGDCEFHVVVPVTQIAHYYRPSTSSATSGTAPAAATSAGAFGAHDEARKQARHRMMALVGEIRDAGATADGELGDADPMTAIQKALADRQFDEIILSTFPQGISRWLKMDLPSKVERHFDGPVTAIISNT